MQKRQRTENSKEFCNTAVKNYLLSKNITHETTQRMH